MKYLKKFHFLIFPLFIIIIGLIIYRVLEYTPNFFTIIINIGLAYLLAPKYKTFTIQKGEETQVKWMFFKKTFLE